MQESSTLCTHIELEQQGYFMPSDTFRLQKRLLRPVQALGVVAATRIRIERIKPSKPQQNGHHERMHLTLKTEATRPAGCNFLQQQAKFDRFMHCYNFERLHQVSEYAGHRRVT
jgi:transposase InsO family protein